MEYHADVAWPIGEITMELSMAEILDLLAGYNLAGGEVVGSATLHQRPKVFPALNQRTVLSSLANYTLEVTRGDALNRGGRPLGVEENRRVHAARHDLWRRAV